MLRGVEGCVCVWGGGVVCHVTYHMHGVALRPVAMHWVKGATLQFVGPFR